MSKPIDYDGFDPCRIYESNQFYKRAGVGDNAMKTLIRRKAREIPEAVPIGAKKVYATGLVWFAAMKAANE